jgi:hypothetical protein
LIFSRERLFMVAWNNSGGEITDKEKWDTTKKNKKERQSIWVKNCTQIVENGETGWTQQIKKMIWERDERVEEQDILIYKRTLFY